jgi:hypothetical protein
MQNAFRSPFRFLAVALLVLTGTAFTAQSAHATTLDVPFAFTVGNQVCPAGRYTVRTDDLGSSVLLTGQSQGFKWVIHPGDPAPTDNRIVLKFDIVGSQYALRSVQYGPMITSRLDKKTKESISARNTAVIGADMGQ